MRRAALAAVLVCCGKYGGTEEPDAGATPVEAPPDLDAATYADVPSIDAPVGTCAEDGLLARWKIDEGFGVVVADCSGNHLHGLITNGTWATSFAATPALAFDGDGYVGFGDPALLRLTGALTVAFWVRSDHDTLTGAETLVGKTTNGNTEGWRVALVPGHAVSFSTPTATSNIYTNGGVVPLGEWRHVAAVYDPGTRLEVYVGGQSVASRGDAPASITPSKGETRLASRSDSAYELKGALSDVRLYSRALSSAEIAALAKKKPGE